MKYFKCENCGSELTKNPDGTCTCGYCRRTYYDDSLEKAYDRVYQNLRGTVQGIVTEELVNQKLEQIATCRQALYKERKEQFVDAEEIARWSGEILRLSPKDAQANFYFLAAKKRWGELNKFMQKLNAREVDYLVEGFVDYLTNGRFVEQCVLCLSDLIDRAFDAGSKEYAACNKKIVAADERERSGVFDVSLPRDVFVAYSSKDKEQAYELVEYLERSGFKCFIAARNLAKGVDAALKYNERLKTAMDSCRVFLLVSSSNSRARDCDAYRIEMQYIRDCDCKKANDPALASARYEEYLEKNRKRCKPRVEYLIEDYGSSPYEKIVKKFFGGLTWCRELERVSDAVFELIEGAGLEDSEEEKFAREKAALEEKLAEEKRERERLAVELEKKQEAALEAQKAEIERQKEELARKERELAQSSPVSTAAPTANIDDLYRAFKEREREEAEERKRQEEIREQNRKAEEERKRKEEEERKRKEEEERERQRELERQRKLAEEKLKRDFEIENGVLKKYHGDDEEVVVPETVKSIGDSAFQSNKKLISVKIPDGVTTIGHYAFKNCDSLLIVELPDGLRSIGTSAFCDCRNLTDVKLPDSVSTIGEGAFSDCSALESIAVGANNKAYKSIDGNLYSKDGKTIIWYKRAKKKTSFTIPDGVTNIAGGAFSAAYNLTSVVIPNSVTSIGESAFYLCDSLTSVYITDIAAWCNIDFGSVSANPLFYAKNLYLNNELVKKLVIPDTVTEIKAYAFYNCTSLTSVKIPDSVTSIGEYAFSDCTSLTNVEIGDSVTSIGNDAFRGCSGLTSVVIPDSVTSMGDYAFSGCSGLTSVEIPDSVTSIANKAFYGCSALTSVVIGDSVTSIGNEAFSGCSGLTSVVLPSGVTHIGDFAFQFCRGLKEIIIPDSVTSIGNDAFFYCTSLTSVEIGDSVTSIGNGAFCGCSALTSVVIPDSVTKIGKSAFNYCSRLRSVVIPDSVTWIGEKAFFDCPIESATIPTIAISSIPQSKLKTVVITSGDSIDSYAFAYCSSLTSVVIGDSVKIVGKDAFKDCSSLTKAEVGKKTKITGAFKNKKIVTYRETEEERRLREEENRRREEEEKRIKRDFEIVNGVLKKYKGEGGNVVIPISVTSIGDGAFSDCKRVTSVEIPNSVTTIDFCAFWCCSGLAKAWLPASVVAIGKNVFFGCPNLTIYAEAKKKPKDWIQPLFGKDSWNPDKRPVKWGATKADFDKA